MDRKKLTYTITDPIEINLSYIPFIKKGGIFIPTSDKFKLGDALEVELTLPNGNIPLLINGNVAWITPQNALHHVIPGVGITFDESEPHETKKLIESMIDKNIDVGGYTYGITDGDKRNF